MLPDATDLIPVLAVSTAARPVFCFARVADDNPRAGILHEAFLDFLSRRPADALAEVVIGDGACPGGESIMVIDVDVSAETDELGERSARFAFFDDRVERRARVVHLGNVPVRVDVRVVDVLAVAVPRCTLFVDFANESRTHSVRAYTASYGWALTLIAKALSCDTLPGVTVTNSPTARAPNIVPFSSRSRLKLLSSCVVERGHS